MKIRLRPIRNFFEGAMLLVALVSILFFLFKISTFTGSGLLISVLLGWMRNFR